MSDVVEFVLDLVSVGGISGPKGKKADHVKSTSEEKKNEREGSARSVGETKPLKEMVEGKADATNKRKDA